MRTPLFLFLISLAFAAAAYVFGNATLTLPLAVSGLAAVAAGLLIVSALVRRPRTAVPAPKDRAKAAPDKRAKDTPHKRRKSGGPHVVIDGSNVMHWDGEIPRLATLRQVIAELRARGCQPGIIFDANAGYKFADRYLDDSHFAKLLDLPGDRVLVVPKGEPADPTILEAARELGAKVLTNDRYRDWAEVYPEVTDPGLLVTGGVRRGKVWLDRKALAA